MTPLEIQKLIIRRNQDDIEKMEQRAASIISEIVSTQADIKASNDRIVELRAELKQLSHEDTTMQSIIGE